MEESVYSNAELDCYSGTDIEDEFVMGLKSPNGSGGRSVKEFEEQMANLRKENFNLKLRIYFLEERLGASFNVDKENAIKKNIELSVEVEALRKEIDEKQELLCQAVKALELEEEEHKKDVSMKDAEIQELKEEIKQLRMINNVPSLPDNNLSYGNQLTLYAAHLQFDNDKTSDILNDLHIQAIDLEKQLKKERNRGDHLERLLVAADCESTKFKELELEIRRKDNKLSSVEEELQQAHYKICSLESQMQEVKEQFVYTKKELDNRVRELKRKEQELDIRDNQMEELKRALLDAEGQMDLEQKKSEKYRTSLSKRNTVLSEKDAYIEKLETKVRHLESCLNEVISQSNDMNLNSPTRKSNNNDVDSFSVHGPKTPAELPTAKKNSPQLTFAQQQQQLSTCRSSSIVETAPAGENDPSLNDIETKSKLLEALQEELSKANEEIAKLKRDQYKAVKIIKTMILTRKEHMQEIENLKSAVVEKEQQLKDLQEKMYSLEVCPVQVENPTKKKSLQEKVNELKFTATVTPATNNESSMAETMEGQELCEQYKALSVELEKQIQVLVETLREKDSQLESLKAAYENLSSELKAKQNRIIDLEFEILANENCQEIGDCSRQEKLDISADKETSFWKKELLEKDKEIARLESELRKRTGDLQTIVNKELWEKNREIEKLQKRHGLQLETKERQIADLKKDIEGKELQLSLLKEKINELGIQPNFTSDLLPVRDESSVNNENKPFGDHTRICLEERKYLLQQIEELKTQMKNPPEKDENREIEKLRTEVFRLHQDLDKAESLRCESQNVCTILSTRLEELCQFLDSLLRQKSVLGFLGNKQKNRLRKIIDQSLDLSRTLSLSISLNPNQSLLQLSNISSLLDLSRDNINVNQPFNDEESSLSILSDEISLTYQSHLKYSKNEHLSSNVIAQQTEIIKVLREQVENLKKEIEIRDVELGNKVPPTEEHSQVVALKNDEEFVDAVLDLHTSRPLHRNLLKEFSSPKSNEKCLLNTSSTTLKNVNVENQSESECWSEPDRTVSMQRMGITEEKHNTSLSSRRNRYCNAACLSTESTEDEENINRSASKRSLTESRHTIVSLHEQVCELEEKLKDIENQLLSSQIAYFESEKALKKERESREDFEQREKELVAQMKETERKLVEAEEREKEAINKMAEYKNMVEILEDFKNNMEAQLNTKDKEMQNRINKLEQEKESAIKDAKAAKMAAEKASAEVQLAQSKLENLQEELKCIEDKTRESVSKEYETQIKLLENTIKDTEEEYRITLESQQERFQEQLISIKELVAKIKMCCSEDYITAPDMEDYTIDGLLNELEHVRFNVETAMSKLKETEENKLNIISANEQKIRSLYEQLDNVSLQHSETMLEKTRLIKEKTSLEQELRKYRDREDELLKQVNEFQKEFSEIKLNFQNQLVHLENLKCSLENKVDYLEKSNTKLRKKLLQMSDHHFGDLAKSKSFSLPNSPSKHLELYPNKTLPISAKKTGAYSRQFSEGCEEMNSKMSYHFLQLQIPNVVELEQQETHQGNSSPDLGIESDQGRFSSLEANINIPRPLLPTLELTESMNNLLDCDVVSVQDSLCSNEDCLKKLKEMLNENSELKKRLLRTRRALEETVTQLTLANKRKKEVEKTICRQIHKTSQVLRKAKANLDSGSESEFIKK